ncbi:glycosyltransferase family 4 protein [Candidatus Woesearchaeota archaeon]|jgi:glycosyltransferase involved in cell wall biosynthesis|nr:glycosyltransferase family 4 protein [Candidatus Woesearchaeota archaeon]
MTKLLIATDNLLPRLDGISVFLDKIIPLLEKKIDVSVVAPDYGKYDYSYKNKVTKFKLVNVRLGDFFPSSVKLRKLAKLVKNCDVVFVQALGPIGIIASFFAKIYRKPLIRYNHSMEWELFPNSLNIKYVQILANILTKIVSLITYNMSSRVLVPSIEHAELLTVIGIRPRKEVVHLGIDEKHYKPPKSKAIAKHELGIDPRTFVIGYAGRIGYEKNLITLYRAFKRISKKFNNVILLIAGGGHPKIEKLFTGKSNIILTGPKNDLLPYYQAMDVYVLPSLTETSSMTTMEAMATGLPVVVTPVGFIKEYIDDGVNGLLFPKKNSYMLYKKLSHLIEHDASRDKLGRKARETMVEHYTWDDTVKIIIKIIESVSVKNS